jgi:hypothetical protein
MRYTCLPLGFGIQACSKRICGKSNKEIFYSPSEADHMILIRISVQRILLILPPPGTLYFHFKMESS